MVSWGALVRASSRSKRDFVTALVGESLASHIGGGLEAGCTSREGDILGVARAPTSP